MKNRIQSFWYGAKISTMELLCLNSFSKNGHTFDLYTYEHIPNLPIGVNQVDANSILNKNKIFTDNTGGIASFSDWFRYKLLYKKGGWWVDLDVVCLKPFDVVEEYCFATENDSAKYGTGITCAVIKAPKKAEFLQIILSHIESFENYKNIQWGEFGPVLLHTVLKTFYCEEFVQSVTMFCPIDWRDMQTLVTENRELPNDSFAIHMWNNLWNIYSLDKNASYPPHCIYEKLKTLYLQ